MCPCIGVCEQKIYRRMEGSVLDESIVGLGSVLEASTVGLGL